MVAVLGFALTLFAAVLVSERAERTALSTSVLFLASGFALGEGVAGVVHLSTDDPWLASVAELALFATLFSDGMRLPLSALRESWRLPARALLLGLPLTLIITAIGARLVLGFGWLDALLFGAVLAPTDPVFAGAIVREERLSASLRRLLNVESGVNDGLALPIVVALLHVAGHQPRPLVELVSPVLLGTLVGFAIAFIAERVERSRFFGAHEDYHALGAFAVGLLVLSVSKLLDANVFLAAFAAGATTISLRPELSTAFERFVEDLASLLKFGALFVLGALIDPGLFARVGLGAYAMIVVVLFVARPLPVLAVLARTALTAEERVVAAWFGPKGFASVLYALMVLHARGSEARPFFEIAALVIAASIILHSSSDVLAATWLARKRARATRGAVQSSIP